MINKKTWCHLGQWSSSPQRLLLANRIAAIPPPREPILRAIDIGQVVSDIFDILRFSHYPIMEEMNSLLQMIFGLRIKNLTGQLTHLNHTRGPSPNMRYKQGHIAQVIT